MADRRPQGNTSAQRITGDIGLLNAQILGQGADVVGHRVEAQRPVDVRSAPMGLQIDGDYLPVLGQLR